MTKLQEINLIEGVLAGDRLCMERFYKSFIPILYPVALRYSRDNQEAKAILNTSMLKVFQAIATFDTTQSLEHWMKTIVLRTGLDQIRSRNRHHETGDLMTLTNVETTISLEGELHRDELLLLLRKLPEMQRTVLILFAVEGFSHSEIGQQLQITDLNSRYILHQARSNFKKILQIENETVQLVLSK
jgi:RNA polymerase sigma factor (sigma-70 family)